MTQFYTFNDPVLPSIEQAGGKGRSLLILHRMGFNVPPTAVLPAEFFQPWIEQLKTFSEWQTYAEITGDGIREAASAVKERSLALAFSTVQQAAITELRSYLVDEGITLMAVRSSSPEEDLAEASFAGIYETVLGVRDENLEKAIKICFASALDERVVLYKQEHGYDPFDPKIAVIIQKQITSQVSGVAFSLNPVTNSYDEVVINANFGLGDTVVDGMVTPDEFAVDKVTNTILKKEAGSKEVSRYVKNEGGTEAKIPANPADFSLSDEQILEITAIICRIESVYNKPVDIEWTYDDGQLYLLQARPITGYYQLPPNMITNPGEKKKMYLDALLTEQGLVENLSPLGEGIFDLMAIAMLTTIGGDPVLAQKEGGLAFSSGGRVYADLGGMMKLTGKKTIINTYRVVDVIGATILENMDLKAYEPDGLLPPKVVLWNTLKMAFGGLPMFVNAIKANQNPPKYLEILFEESEKLEQDLKAEYEKELPFEVFSRSAMDKTIAYMNFIALPTLMASERARSGIKKLFRDEPQEIRDQVIYIEQAFPDNVTIEMGLLLYDLSQSPEIRETGTADEFVHGLENRQFSSEFMGRWGEFVARYGHRYPKEIDVATPRYREKPGEVFALLKTMESAPDPELSPRVIFEKGALRRRETVKVLEDVLLKQGKKKLGSFQKKYAVLKAFAAYREIPKYYIILAIDYIRRMLLVMAEKWVEERRLDSVEQVFTLTYEEVIHAEKDPGLDLRALIEANAAFYGKFSKQLNPPVVIDSRGYIPTLPRIPAGEKELIGTPVSPGIVIGPVNILTRPDEKPVRPGDILVTRATDPGWTTLFLNAGGVLLETGGTLQHGASVARESCKPCIVGLDQVTSLLEDGQLVELDGTTGIVTIL
jgi:pyruvate,water dikinase